MNLKTIAHAPDASKEVVKRLMEKNISWKLDQYLKKFEWENKEWMIEIKADTNKKWLFDATLIATLDGKSYHYHREDYSNLDDLVNNLFDHLKEGLSSK
jgi:hypothetical protein